MKCDLCEHAPLADGRLCDTCADAIQRLMTIQEQAEQSRKNQAQRVAFAG